MTELTVIVAMRTTTNNTVPYEALSGAHQRILTQCSLRLGNGIVPNILRRARGAFFTVQRDAAARIKDLIVMKIAVFVEYVVGAMGFIQPIERAAFCLYAIAEPPINKTVTDLNAIREDKYIGWAEDLDHGHTILERGIDCRLDEVGISLERGARRAGA